MTTLLSSSKDSYMQKKQILSVLKSVYTARLMDEKMTKLVRQNKGGNFHLSTLGHELVGVIAAKSLQPKKDWGFPYYRDRAFALGLGCSKVDILAALMARQVDQHSGGRQMPEHFSHTELRIPVQSSVVGSQFLQAVGCAKGRQLLGDDDVIYVSAGDGATSQGDFHEALNFSCVHKLPIVFVIQDNGWAISVPVSEQTAGGSIVPIASGYEGLSVFSVDGTNYVELSESMQAAVAKARSGKGPSLVVAKVPRIGPHSSSDDPKKYKTEEMFSQDKEKDPLVSFENWILEKGIFGEQELVDLRQVCFEEVEEAARQADLIPHPDPSTASTKVYAKVEYPKVCPLKKKERTESVVIMDALNHALLEEMEKDPNVIVFGQDVADGKGGVFGITRGLTNRFGKDRCFNTPLAESTIIGLATGLSLDGVHKPVAEIQFADYSWTGMNQLINEVSSIHYRSDGKWNCPIVVRMPYGGYIQGGPYHSQSIEGYLAHCPGLKIVIPSNAADAKMLLKSAIRDPNPVVFLEHKALYRQRAFSAAEEPHKDEFLPLGKANIVREGEDLTVVAWGMMVVMAVEIADLLKKEGYSIEVIDLRTISPIDTDTIYQSVEKTSKVLIAHEAARTCGFGAELAAMIQENAFMNLDAPIRRIGAKDCPVPFSKFLEDKVLPQKQDIEKAIRELLAY